MSYVIVDVKQEHIDKGYTCDSCRCPIALAMKTLNRGTPLVGPDEAYLGNDCFQLPVKATRFINRFDAGRKVKPFSFRLKLPAQ